MTVEEEREMLRKTAASENNVWIVAEENGEIVGTMNGMGGKRKANRHTVGFGISVRKDRRNKGIGNALMVYFLNWARETGVVTRVELSVYCENAAATHLYEKFGFEREGVRRRSFFRGMEYVDDMQMALLL